MIFSKYKLSATSYDLPSARSDHKGVVSPHINDKIKRLYRIQSTGELDVQDVQELQDVVQGVQELHDVVQEPN